MAPQYIAIGVRIHTAANTYATYLPIEDEIGYVPPRVQLNIEEISAQTGGFGYRGVYVPLAVNVSRKLLLRGRNSDLAHDPATTLTLSQPPTSCDITVKSGYQKGQKIDIPLVP